MGAGSARRSEGSYLELFDLELDSLDVGAEPHAPQLLQLLLRLPQPRPDAVQVRLELLPLLETLFHSQLLAQGLGLDEFPPVDHTWRDPTHTQVSELQFTAQDVREMP